MLEECLARIRELDPELRAWVEVTPQEPLGDGPLNGMPFGAKDIFETRGLATEFGSPLYAGRKGETDSALVLDLRRRGAVLVGKTQTTAFAYFDAAPTRNPRDGRYSPGGSSSGSAAAVAAGMVPLALGSQTQGSVLRPASFCGVVGFKPTFGLLPLEGVLPFAPTLDTAGLFTRTAAEMRQFWERMGHGVEAGGQPRMGVPEWFFTGEPVMQTVFQQSVARLRGAGFPVDRIQLPQEFARLFEAVRLVNRYEGARTHRQRWEEHGDAVGSKLAQLVREGLAIPEEEYRNALHAIGVTKHKMAPLFTEYPVMLTPAAPGPAPFGLASTGDPKMNLPWTGLGVPAISVPMPVDGGMPLGLQMTAAQGEEAVLLKSAVDVEACFAS